jgi:hypothetical protein
LQKVLSQGFDDSAWPLQTKTGRLVTLLTYLNPRLVEEVWIMI